MGKKSNRSREVNRTLAAWRKSLRATPRATPLMCLTLVEGKGMVILSVPGCSEEATGRVFLALARVRMEGGQ